MIQKIELITKKITKLMNSKAQKEADIKKLTLEIEKMNTEIIESEDEVIKLFKEHQKGIKKIKRTTPISERQ